MCQTVSIARWTSGMVIQKQDGRWPMGDGRQQLSDQIGLNRSWKFSPISHPPSTFNLSIKGRRFVSQPFFLRSQLRRELRSKIVRFEDLSNLEF